MFCKNCGCENMNDAKFCKRCGIPLENTESKNQKPFDEATNLYLSKNEKVNKAINIVNIVAGSLLILIGCADLEYIWGEISFLGGIGLLVVGIMQLLKKPERIIHIIKIVFGALLVIEGLLGDLNYDWSIIGLLMGITFLVPGIQGLLKKSLKASSIVEIVFSGLLLLWALGCSEFEWGTISLYAGAAFLTGGILKLVNLK